MTAIELFHSDGKPSGIFYCGKCRIVHETQAKAESCCDPNRCACGAELERFRLRCDACDLEERKAKERARIEAATLVEPTEEWILADGYGHRDGWFESVNDLIEWCEENDVAPPEFAFCGKNVGVPKANVGDITEQITAEMWDDADENDLHGVEELSAAIDKFNEANVGVTVWQVDYSRKVRVRPVESK